MTAALNIQAETAARIGPNAITRLHAVLLDRLGRGEAERLFALAGLARYVSAPPEGMVEETEVLALHRQLRLRHGPALSHTLAFEAGERTADYLLARRIPKPAQFILKRLPRRLASRVLLRAVSRHAWTFAGSGRFTVLSSSPAMVSIADNPLCRGERADQPTCAFYTGTFQRLYRVLVSPDALARETACESMGDPACVIAVSW